MRLLICAVFLFAWQAIATTPLALSVENGQVRQPMPGRTVTAGYLTLHNPTDQAMRLTGVSSPAFERVELHQHSHKDGMMRMEEIDEIVINAQSSVELAPGGLHLMLFTPQSELEIGQTVPVLLHFANGQQLDTVLPVVAMPKR